MKEEQIRYFTVKLHGETQNRIVPEPYENMTGFLNNLRHRWSGAHMTLVYPDKEMMINPDYIVSISGPFDTIYTVEFLL